jgi:hypothetical protein
LERQERGFVACFTLNILMVHSPKLTIVKGSNHHASIGFTLGKAIRFGSSKLIADRFSNLSLSPMGNDSSTVFMGMDHNGMPSLHTILEESFEEDDTTSSERGNSGFPISRGRNVVILTIPIKTTPPSKSTLAPLTILMVPLWTAILQPDIGLPAD